jgi:hypothetical protein
MPRHQWSRYPQNPTCAAAFLLATSQAERMMHWSTFLAFPIANGGGPGPNQVQFGPHCPQFAIAIGNWVGVQFGAPPVSMSPFRGNRGPCATAAAWW